MILLGLMLAATAPDCTNAVAQRDMTACAVTRGKRADLALNAAWKRLAARKATVALLPAQRQWLRFRDAECTAEASAYQGGSMQPMVQADCYADLTEERAKRLTSLAEDAER